ncbi:hypothetical protein R1flu_026467 [Riccia fluitans]|uniref:F-box domain-containing protein n=1 Tax=Riccia fluitans TaxID=41844 RepID=A0ABD1XG12_9MARC
MSEQKEIQSDGSESSTDPEMYFEHLLFPNYIRQQDTVPMDNEVWKQLPHSLVESLLSRLPLCERVPLRPVCKSWSQADGASGNFRGDADLQALPVMVGDSSLSIYNVRKNIWNQKSMRDVYLNDVVSAFESSGGLILALTLHSAKLLVVHNPITRKSRYLLPPKSFMVPLERERIMSSWNLVAPRARYLHDLALNYDGLTGLYRGMIGLVCDEERCKYHIIMACTKGDFDNVTHLYNSVTGEWSHGGQIPAGISFWYGGDNRIVCNGSLYCLVKGRFGHEGDPCCSLAKYDLSSNEWIVWPVPDFREGFYPFLVEHGKRVIFITQSPGGDSLHFYAINEDECWSRNSWKLIARMPKSLWSEFKTKADPLFTRCAGQKNLIYFTGRKRKGSGVVALVIDPTRGLYHWLPHLADDHLVFQLRVYKPSLMPV